MVDASFRSQFGEAEVSSSQSSSIDPHTPSVNGDLAPHTSDDPLVVKPDFSADTQSIMLDMDMGNVSVDTMSSAINTDPRSHWSRLMTRLNSSEESSPRGTPQAVTPTPPITSMPVQSEPPHVSPFHQAINGSIPVEPANQEQPGVKFPQKALNRHSSFGPRSASVSFVPFQLQPLPGVETLETRVESAGVSSTTRPVTSPDALAKRTKQLQLLDSVLAEQSTTRTSQQPPTSSHIDGMYPHTSNGLFPDQVRMPIRPASVNLDPSHTQSIPFHHPQSYISIPGLSGVLPALAPAPSLHHQPIRPFHGQSHLSLRGNGLNTAGRPTISIPSQLPLTTPSASHLPLLGGSPLDTTHQGQILSILSGEASALRYTNSGASFRAGSTLHGTSKYSNCLHSCLLTLCAAATSRQSHRSLLSTGATPRGANAHLLSILNRPSTASRISPAPLSLH